MTSTLTNTAYKLILSIFFGFWYSNNMDGTVPMMQNCFNYVLQYLHFVRLWIDKYFLCLQLLIRYVKYILGYPIVEGRVLTGHILLSMKFFFVIVHEVNGHCKGISPQNMALYGTVSPIQDPEITIDEACDSDSAVLSHFPRKTLHSR